MIGEAPHAGVSFRIAVLIAPRPALDGPADTDRRHLIKRVPPPHLQVLTRLAAEREAEVRSAGPGRWFAIGIATVTGLALCAVGLFLVLTRSAESVRDTGDRVVASSGAVSPRALPSATAPEPEARPASPAPQSPRPAVALPAPAAPSPPTPRAVAPAPPSVSSSKLAEPAADPATRVARAPTSPAGRAPSAAVDGGPTETVRPPAPTRVLGAVQVAPGPRVVVHVDRAWLRRDPDGVTRLVGRLRDAGAGSVEVVDVDIRIGRDQVRFYFDEDRTDADRLSSVIARPDPGDGGSMRTPDVRDFTSYRPLPRAGTIEIWMASLSSSAALN